MRECDRETQERERVYHTVRPEIENNLNRRGVSFLLNLIPSTINSFNNLLKLLMVLGKTGRLAKSDLAFRATKGGETQSLSLLLQTLVAFTGGG